MTSLTAFVTRARKLDDFLSPILVKELRQGMRARAFVLSFILIQVFLIVVVLGNIAAEGDRSSLDFQNNFFWVIIGFALLVLMPLRGLVAISLEVRNHTMETIMLTRLSAWRVVFGKWSALFAQSLLFVAAVLPYVVLRYFIGGDDVVSDFELLLFMLWLSGMIISASIAVSALGNAIVRLILIIVGLWILGAGGSGLVEHPSSGGEFWSVVGWLVLAGFFIPALFFEFTASSIAPASENHAVRRRVLALAFFITAILFDWMTGGAFEPGIFIPLIVLIGICYFELAEKPRLVFRLVQPLRKFGWMGRVIGIFFLPGWPSALLFSLIVIPTAILVSSQLKPFTDGLPVSLVIFATFGSVLVPVLVCQLIWTKMNQIALAIALYNIVLLGVASLVKGFASLTHWNLNEVLAFIPGLPVLFSFDRDSSQPDFVSSCLIGNSLVLIILIVVLFVASRRYFRDLFAILRSGEIPKSAPDTVEPGAAIP